MRRRTACLALGLSVGLLSTTPVEAQEAHTTFGIGNAAGSQTFQGQVNIGIPPSQLPAIIEAATKPLKDLTDAQRQDLERIRTQLEVSEGVLRQFLHDVGMTALPAEQQALQLAEIAKQYKELLAKFGVISSDDPEVQQLKDKAGKALSAGNFARAEELLNQAKARDLAAVERMQVDIDARQFSASEAAARNGDLMITQLRYADAARYYAEAIRYLPKYFNYHLMIYLERLGTSYTNLGNYKEALKHLENALSVGYSISPMFERIFNLKRDWFVADVREALCNLYSNFDIQKSEDICLPLLEDIEQYGLEGYNLGIVNYHVAYLYWYSGRYAEAEMLYRRSLAIMEKALPPDHPELSILMHNVATFYWITDRSGEAEPLYKRSLAIMEKVLPPDHPMLAKVLHSLAKFYSRIGRSGEAEPLYKRSLAIMEKALPSDYPMLAECLNNLAGLYRATGRDAEAEPLYKQALTILEKTLPPGHQDLRTVHQNYTALLKQLHPAPSLSRLTRPDH